MTNRDIYGRKVEEVLQFELDFLEQGGYGRSVHTPRLPKILFRDSPSCLNFDDELRTHPCSACVLMDYVPEEERNTLIPCHHIPLNERGETISSLFDPVNERKAQDALAQWLRNELARLRERRETSVSQDAESGGKWCAET
jgi:hypothetical protein